MTFTIQRLILALLTTAACSAFAAPFRPAGEVPRVEVIVDRADLNAAEAVLAQRDFDTTYLMSTGRQLNVATLGDSLRVRYGRRAPATLRHDGQGRFVSRDGELALRFALDEAGEPQLVRLSLPAPWQ